MVFSTQILGRQRNAFLRCGLVVAALGLSVLAGCGQKGPLFLVAPAKLAPPILSTPPPAVLAPALPASAAR